MRINIKVFSFFLLLFGNMLAQTADTCYFPLEMGNKWQYLYIRTGDANEGYSIKNYEIVDTISNEGRLYYSNSPLGRANYDTTTKILRVYNSTPTWYWDFSNPVGWSMPGSSVTLQTRTFFDRTELCPGKVGNSGYRDTRYFMNNVGMLNYTDGFLGVSLSMQLIGCILTNGSVYVDSAKPTIDFVSDSSTANNNILKLKIDHKYSGHIPHGANNTYTYIDTAKLYYYYSHGNDSTAVDSLSLVHDGENIFSVAIPKWNNLTDEYALNYKIVATDKALIQHTTSYPETGFAKLIISSIGNEGNDLMLNSFSLNQNYPNPFNPSTTIEFSIPTNGRVELKIFDVLGKEVATLINGELSAGSHKLEFNSNSAKNSLSSGIYFYSIRYNGVNTITKKMILTK